MVSDTLSSGNIENFGSRKGSSSKMASVEEGESEPTKVISPIRRSAEEIEEQLSLLKSFGGSTESVNSRDIRRNIILEEEHFIETFLRCLICRELFDSSERPPKLLPCHHTLCLECILKIFHGEVDYRIKTIGLTPAVVSFVCPNCRKHFITQESGLLKLPTDHRVIQLIDFVRHTDIQTVQYCLKHKHQPLNFFCERCCHLVCRDCTIIDHKESEGHAVFDIERAIERYSPLLDKAMSELDSQNVSLKEKRHAVEQSIETMTNAEHELVETIRSSFSRLKLLLEEREQELVGMAESSIDSEKQKLKEKMEEINSRCKDIDEKYQELKAVKDDGSVDKMFKAQEEVKAFQAKTQTNIPEIDEGIVTKFSFSDRDERYLSNRIKSYGDVLTQIERTSKVPPSHSSSSSSSYGSSYGGYGGGSSYGSSSYSRYTPSSYSSYGNYSSGRSYYRP